VEESILTQEEENLDRIDLGLMESGLESIDKNIGVANRLSSNKILLF